MSNLENMDTLAFRERINQRRRHSQPLTDEEINFITQQSAELAGAASEQVNPYQIQWASKAEQLLSKPVNEITIDDARNITSKEARAFESLPATGSVASHIQSAAAKNDEES